MLLDRNLPMSRMPVAERSPRGLKVDVVLRYLT
jgi:hypothetical protein